MPISKAIDRWHKQGFITVHFPWDSFFKIGWSYENKNIEFLIAAKYWKTVIKLYIDCASLTTGTIMQKSIILVLLRATTLLDLIH